MFAGNLVAHASLASLLLAGSLHAQQTVWHLSPLNGHWYAATPAGDWEAARSTASIWSGHLATVRNQAENDWIRSTFPTELWIGLSDDGHEGTWVWENGEPVAFTNWAVNQPDNNVSCDCGCGPEHWCELLLGAGEWNDANNTNCYFQPGLVELDSVDCDGNGLPDRYEFSMNPILDGNNNGVLDICEPGVPYCTSSTTTSGCTPSMSGSGTPSASQPSGFNVTCSGVEGQRYGLIFYGLSPTAVAWAINSTSYVCVAPPQQRTGVQDSGGTNGACDGTFSIDFNAYMTANPTSVGSPFLVGDTFYAQAWFRDPGAPKGTNLSDGVRFTLCH